MGKIASLKLLREIAEVRTGYSFRGRVEHDAAGDVSVVQMKDVDEGSRLNSKDLARVFMDDPKDRHLVKRGDLLFRSRGLTNTAALVTSDLDRAILAAPLISVRPHPEQVVPKFLHWYMNHPNTQRTLESRAVGTAVKLVSKRELEELEIELPPVDRQHAIAEIAELAIRENTIRDELTSRRRILVESLLMGAVRQSSRGEKARKDVFEKRGNRGG